MESSHNYIDRAIAGYVRTCAAGERHPERVHCYELRTRHGSGERHYIMLADARDLVAIYRVRRGGVLWLLASTPAELREHHRQRMRHAAAPA